MENKIQIILIILSICIGIIIGIWQELKHKK